MPVDYASAKDLHEALKRKHERRHWELKALRRYWQGDYWQDNSDGRAGVASVQQLFLDLKGRRSDMGPDLKIVHNLLQEACVKYQTFLSPVPMIRTFRDPPFSENKRAQATLKERVLYGTWAANTMPVRMADIGWYLPLMGDCFVGIWPDYDSKVPRMVIRSPEIAHPVKSYDGQKLDLVMFCWEQDERSVLREYPAYKPQADTKGKYRITRRKMNAGGDRKVEMLEYSDGNELGIWGGEQKLKEVPHGFGFNLYGQMAFIRVPGEDFNHGAVEQIVTLVEMGNVMHSLVFQAAIDHVFPTLKIINPAMAPETMNLGAGGVLTLNTGGDAEYMTPPVQALPVQVGFLNDNKEKIFESAGVPPVARGYAPTSSVSTGKAINELQGAGTGTTVEMVVGAGIGPELSSWNEKALFIYRELHGGDKISLYGLSRTSGEQQNARQYALSFKGSEIIGSQRNEVVFSPHLNDHEKLVMGLQKLGAGLVAKSSVRDDLGIADNDAEVEKIIAEQIEDGLIQAMLAELQAQPDQETGRAVEARANAIVEATPMPAAGPHPLLAAGAPAGLAPGAPGQLSGGGMVTSPPLPLPQGAPPPAQSGAPAPPGGAAPAPAAAPSGGVSIQDAISALQRADIKGDAYLVGEIVARGSTQDAVEIAVTDEADKQALQNAAAFPVVFHLVDGEPKEPFVDVKTGQQGGSAQPLLPELATA